MSILVDDARGIIQLNTAHTTYQMQVNDIGMLCHYYYGEKLATLDDLSYTQFYRGRGHIAAPVEKGSYKLGKDANAQYTLEIIPQEMSAFGVGDFRSTGICVRQDNGTAALQLRYAGHQVYDGKYAIPELPAAYDELGDCKTLEVTLVDIPTKLQVKLLYGVFENADVITRATIIENGLDTPVMVEKAASLNLDFDSSDYDMIDFYGSWGRERTPERTPLRHGMNSFGSVRGESSALYNPSMLLVDHDATETKGNAYGFAFVYSGEHKFEVERTVDDRTRVIIGINPEDFRWKLEPGEKFFAPEVLMTYSGAGIGGVSLQFHDFIRKSIVRGPWRDKRRPVLLNNWEGTYFEFNGKKLIQMAEQAAKAGVEMFVLDDGWFGKRDTATTGLGDWYPNEKKLGMTIKELGEKIRKTGVLFGLWFEPECISEDSDLYRAHPDWAIAIPGRAPHVGRNQYLIDMSRKDVQDYLIEQMSKVIREGGVAYVKWDLNRSLCDRFSALLPADRMPELAHRFVLGTYRVLEALIQQFPDLLIEGCSSGGARFDAGMLYYTPQIWTSDDTDAIERLGIQYGTSMIYPVNTMGAHVSAVPNHQTGRIVSMNTRAAVAMSGTFGYELDITTLPDADKKEMKAEIELFHKYYDVIQHGDYYRLIAPDTDTCTVWEQVTKDKSLALVTIVFHRVRPCPIQQRIHIQGLDPNAKYRIRMIRDDYMGTIDAFSQANYGGNLVLSGKTLEQVGLNAPMSVKKKGIDHVAWQFEVRKVEE